MRIVVFGAGGAGGYFGGRLAQAGEEVVFIARGEHLRAIRSHGLRVESVLGDFVISPAHATDDPSQVGAADAVLVCVKAWQVLEAAEAIHPLLRPGTMVVPVQNGVEAPAQLATVLGQEHVLGGLAKIFSLIAAPGHIRHFGAEPYVAFGELDGCRSERAEMLRAAFQRAGVMAEIPPDIQTAMWEKFLFVIPFGGLGAVTRAPIGILRSQPGLRQMLEQAMREILDVARARGIVLADEAIGKALAYMDTLPPGGTASLQRDIIEGRPSELEAWSGAVVRLGHESGVPTPIHSFIYHSLMPLEARARGQLQFEV